MVDQVTWTCTPSSASLLCSILSRRLGQQATTLAVGSGRKLGRHARCGTASKTLSNLQPQSIEEKKACFLGSFRRRPDGPSAWALLRVLPGQLAGGWRLNSPMRNQRSHAVAGPARRQSQAAAECRLAMAACRVSTANWRCRPEFETFDSYFCQQRAKANNSSQRGKATHSVVTQTVGRR